MIIWSIYFWIIIIIMYFLNNIVSSDIQLHIYIGKMAAFAPTKWNM